MNKKDLSPILALFRQWDEAFATAGRVERDEEIASWMDKARSIEKRIMAIPAGTAAELAAKLIVCTQYGDFELSDRETGVCLSKEILLLTGGRGHGVSRGGWYGVEK